MEPMRVKITANAEVVTAAEMAVATALNNTDLRGRWEIAEIRVFIERLRELGFSIMRA